MPAICGAAELKASLIVVARREAPCRNRSLAFAIKAHVAGDPGRRGAQPRRSDAFTIGKYGLGTLLLLGKLMAAFYVTCLIFIFVVLGGPVRGRGSRRYHLIEHRLHDRGHASHHDYIADPEARCTRRLSRMRSTPLGMRVRRRIGVRHHSQTARIARPRLPRPLSIRAN
jgi:hypothetical protein